MSFALRSLLLQAKRRRTDWKGVCVGLGAPSVRCGGVKNLFLLSRIEPDAYLVIPVCHPPHTKFNGSPFTSLGREKVRREGCAGVSP